MRDGEHGKNRKPRRRMSDGVGEEKKRKWWGRLRGQRLCCVNQP